MIRQRNRRQEYIEMIEESILNKNHDNTELEYNEEEVDRETLLDRKRMAKMIANHDMKKVKDYMNKDDFSIEALGKAYMVRVIEDFKNHPNGVTAARIKSPLFEDLYSVYVDSDYYEFIKRFLGKRLYKHKTTELEQKAADLGFVTTRELEKMKYATSTVKKRKELFSNEL